MNVCGIPAGPEDERSGGCDGHLTADPERQLTVDDVEPLVLAAVHVQGRTVPARGEVLDHGDASRGALASTP